MIPKASNHNAHKSLSANVDEGKTLVRLAFNGEPVADFTERDAYDGGCPVVLL